MKIFRLEMFFAAALLAAAAGTATAQQPSAASYKIGFVNVERIMRESRESKRLLQALETEFRSREAEIARGPKDNVNQRMAALYEDMNLKREEAQKQVIEKANAAIQRIGRQENLDAVFYEATFASARIDLTDKVIQAIDAGR
jgi:outer membrane protein